MLGIVVDSTSALSRGEAARYAVTVVENTYLLDGATLAESYIGENGDYAAGLAAGKLTETHAPTVEAFRLAFENLAHRGCDILCVTISSRLSSTYQHACKAADLAGSAAQGRAPRIAVLDSLSGFSNNEYLVRRARQLEQQGLTFDAIIDDLVQARTRQGLCFSVPSVDPLRRSGRLSMVPQSVNAMLNRYPLFTIKEGAIAFVDTARGVDVLAERMVAQVPAGVHELTLAHYGQRGPFIVELLKATRAAFPQTKVRVKDGGPVLSCSLGNGAASIAWAPLDGSAGE